MAVEYLKKTKMHELAKSLVPDIPPVRKCEYKFYRGSEWLTWYPGEECNDGWIEYRLYSCRSYYSLDKVQHLESEFKEVTLDRKVFTHKRALAV